METGSIIETIGHEIIGVMSPVSICMFLVVLLVYSLQNPNSTFLNVTTAANLIYSENPSDPTSQKLEGAIENAVVFVLIITLVTFLIVLLYYYRFNHFLLYYTRFSVFTIFAGMGSSILISILQRFNIPIDVFTFTVLLFNVAVVGTISVFSDGMPIVFKQGTMVLLGIIAAVWFTRMPEWTTWAVLVALAVYDLIAVLAPGGPLKLLLELASKRDEELPALVYETRPNVGGRGGGLGLLVAAADGESGRGSVELQQVMRSRGNENFVVTVENEIEEVREDEVVTVENGIEEVRDDEGEMLPLIGDGSDVNSTIVEDRSNTNRDVEMEEESDRGIRLGMGDFIFYSVLVGRAAMYDLMTVYACYLAIISGVGCTLMLLAVCRRGLPALPISITLGVMFYFLTRLVMEPFVVGASTNLMMF